MNAHRTNWPLAMSVALTLTLMSGEADARGGGHAGAVAHPMAPAPQVATTPSPGVGLPGAHPASGLPGGILHQPYPNGAIGSPAATTVTSPAMASRPQAIHGATATPKGNGSSVCRSSSINFRKRHLAASGATGSGDAAVRDGSARARACPHRAPLPTAANTIRHWCCHAAQHDAIAERLLLCGQPRRIGAKRAGRRRQVAGRLHGLLGPRDAHGQGRVEGGLRAHHAGLPDGAALTAIAGASRDRENQGSPGVGFW